MVARLSEAGLQEFEKDAAVFASSRLYSDVDWNVILCNRQRSVFHGSE